MGISLKRCKCRADSCCSAWSRTMMAVVANFARMRPERERQPGRKAQKIASGRGFYGMLPDFFKKMNICIWHEPRICYYSLTVSKHQKILEPSFKIQPKKIVLSRHIISSQVLGQKLQREAASEPDPSSPKSLNLVLHRPRNPKTAHINCSFAHCRNIALFCFLKAPSTHPILFNCSVKRHV